MRSRYMLFCFMTVFSFTILFVMFQNSLSRPAIETLVTETHKQINNFKNFKVKKTPPRQAATGMTPNTGPFPTQPFYTDADGRRMFFFFFFKPVVLKRISGQPEGGRAKGTCGGHGLFVCAGICTESRRLSRRVLEKHHPAGGGHVRTGRRTQSGHRLGDVRGQVPTRPCDTRIQLGYIRLSASVGEYSLTRIARSGFVTIIINAQNC